MGSMSLTRKNLERFLNDVFIETGSYDGSGVLLAREIGFRICHTIELDPERVLLSRKNLSGLSGVVVHDGDTVDILPKILSQLRLRATIFLDAHPVGLGDACKIGQYRYPLLHELDLIKTHSLRNDHAIIVDDRHEFPLYPTTDEEVAQKLLEINPKYHIWVEGNMVNAIVPF